MKNTKTLQGEVTWVFIDRKTKTFKYRIQHNAILANAKTILLYALTGNGDKVDAIKVNYSGNDVTANVIQVSYPSYNQVTYKALVGEDEAVGLITALTLKSNTMGDFSWINALSVTKPAGIELLIHWKITFMPCAGILPPVLQGAGLLYQSGAGVLYQAENGIYLNI